MIKDDPEFDVTMGKYGGAELCELVGLYVIDLLTKEFSKQDIGWDRDDGLSCFENISSLTQKKLRRKHLKSLKPMD